MTVTLEHRPRLGFFTRVLDAGGPRVRFADAIEQIRHAEESGFDVAWVAQHHFHENEGGLSSPFVFLSHVAALTSRIRLGTAIVTLATEAPIRVAEDAANLDLLSGGRLELGFGSGGTPSSFPPFGFAFDDRRELYDDGLARVREALVGADLSADHGTLYPPAPELTSRIWEATFSIDGARRIGTRGNGLLLSKLQPRGPGDRSLADTQRKLVDAYLEALPADAAPRVMASRGVLVTDAGDEAKRLGVEGLARGSEQTRAFGLGDIVHGDVDEVTERLAADPVFLAATDWSFQVHPIDPPHPVVLRSVELLATRVAPALGWTPSSAASAGSPSTSTPSLTNPGEA